MTGHVAVQRLLSAQNGRAGPADGGEGEPGVLRAAEAEVLAALPVRTHVSRAWLMTGTQAPDSWQLRATFPLGT